MSLRSHMALLSFGRDTRGVAAVEFSIAATMTIVGILNAVDVGLYEYRRMQVENAAQVGAQAAWKACYDTSSMLPATTKCTALNNAITAAIQSTSLGTAVSLSSGYPQEGYYCANSSGVLQSVGDLSNKPANCSVAGNSSATPGDYIQVSVTYNYAPLFSNLTVMGAWGISSISMTSWMRLG
jgi:Flp pilus assembly protein TadG